MIKDHIDFGSERIDFTLQYVERKTLGISVHPDRSVDVYAPMDANGDTIKSIIRKRAPWILKQQDHFLSFEPRTPQRKYISGETHLYLGRQYQLKVVKNLEEQVKYTGRFIEVHANNKEHVEALLYGWYVKKANLWFKKLSTPLIKHFEKYNVRPKKIEIRKMKYRWGSCSSTGRILLNPELMQAPKPCIEYVIIHELCHLIHHDHTKAFFELQTKEMPDWEKWKMRLEHLLS